MKIDFEKVCYDEEGQFLLFKSNPEKYYLARVLDFKNGLRFDNTVENSEKIVNGSCTTFEYLLTKDEFELYESDKESFVALINRLCTEAPADRFLKAFTQATPQSKPEMLKVKSGEPIDTEINLIKQMQTELREGSMAIADEFKKFLAGENDLDIYFVHSSHLNKIFPAIDFEGKIFFVENEDNVKGLIEATKIFENQYYKVNGEQALEILRNCKKFGAFKVMYCKANGTAYGFDRDELLGEPTEDKWSTYNSPIYNAFIRCIECAGIENPQVKANQMTLTSQLSHHIFKTTFLVPLTKSAEQQPETIVLSRASEALYKEKEFAFLGADGYKYVPLEGNEFTATTLVNSNDKSRALPLFTDLEEFNKIFNGKAVPIAVTLDEAFSMLNELCNIIIFNPATLAFVFTPEAMKQMKEFSEKPPTIFKPKEEAPKEKPTTVQMPAPLPPQASTEDILHLVANQINRDEAVKKEQTMIAKKEDDEATEKAEENTDNADEAVDEVAEVAEAEEASEEEATDATDEATNDDTSDKKGGFFSRFKKKKK
ncbi:MAG: SseB family protein [Acutalibacteraceae bacterium]|nr:SseB family protein [Acutalibacteraceae bacterium]